MESTLVQLIKHFEDYKVQLEGKADHESMTGFLLYLNTLMGQQPPVPSREAGFEGWQHFNRQTLAEMAVSYIGKMGRYVENYSRKELPQTQVPSIEEFTYLIVLLQFDGITKTELIQHNAHPITTGTEIIKRLIRKGFITQQDNPDDKRSVRVYLSDAGRMAIFSTTEATKAISTLATGILSDEELIFLSTTLKRLDIFHDKIQREARQMELVEIIDKYLPESHSGLDETDGQ